MKHFLPLSLLCGAMSLGALAQNTVLKVDTAMTTHSSGGNRFSAIFTPSGDLFGTLMNQPQVAYLAEDFTIPASTTWAIDSVIVYGYETNLSPVGLPVNTITGGTVRIFNGAPDAGGTVVAGDTTTNRFANASFTGIYRVDTTTTTTSFTRPIFRIALTGMSNILPAGTYWVEWSTTGSTTLTGPWGNPKVLPNATNPASQNALSRFGGTGNIWRPAKDSSVQGDVRLGYNFMLKGRINPTSIASTGAATGFSLAGPFPNPATGTTNLSFSLGAKSRVSLRILNAVGQQMAVVVEDELSAGEYTIPFNTIKLASGVYRVVLQTDQGSNAVPLTVK